MKNLYILFLLVSFGLVVGMLLYWLKKLISRVKKLNLVIRKNETRQSAIIRGIPDAIYIFSDTGLLKETLVSNNLIRFSVGAQTISTDIDNIFMLKNGRLKSVIPRLIENGKTFKFEFSRNDEMFQYDFEGRIIKLDEHEVLVIIRDISDEKKMQRHAEEAKAREIQAIKMAELGEVAGGVAHEINNPLAIIQGSVELLLKQIRAPEANHEVVEHLASNINLTVRRISKIVQGLKIFAHDGSQDPLEKVSIRNLIDESIAYCHKKITELGIDLKVIGLDSGPDSEITIEGREAGLIQVVSNLIGNSCDAVEGLETRFIAIAVSSYPGEIEIAITDSGKGIRSELIDKIMTPFFTTKPVGKGTGLGLSIARGIVRSHHGKIFVDAESPHTRFVLRLPKFQGSKLNKSA
ncbi:MAG: ATP-binding protein [Pseudomonadota bacterium]|nr:ATP-binding protein [Pseudomonadota bacterium]